MPNDQATAQDSLHPNLSVGEALKKSRQSKKIQLRTVADQLRIRLEYLEAIENGHFKKLPGMAYGIGFVRTYAEYLDLDPQPFIDQFKAENSTSATLTMKPPPKPKLDIQGINPRYFMIGGGILALVLLGWFLFSGETETPPRVTEVPPKIADSVANPQETTAPPVTSLAIVPPDRSKAAATAVKPATPAATAPIYGQGSNPTPLFKPKAAAEVAPAAPTAAAPTTVLPKVKPPTPTPTPTPVQEIPKLRPPAAAAPAAATPAPNPATPAVAAAGQITLSAPTNPVWFEVTNAAGQIIKSKTLLPGESYLVPTQPGLKLTTGNAGGIVITLNGKTAPKLGEVGKTRRGIALDASLFTAGAQ